MRSCIPRRTLYFWPSACCCCATAIPSERPIGSCPNQTCSRLFVLLDDPPHSDFPARPAVHGHYRHLPAPGAAVSGHLAAFTIATTAPGVGGPLHDSVECYAWLLRISVGPSAHSLDGRQPAGFGRMALRGISRTPSHSVGPGRRLRSRSLSSPRNLSTPPAYSR